MALATGNVQEAVKYVTRPREKTWEVYVSSQMLTQRKDIRKDRMASDSEPLDFI